MSPLDDPRESAARSQYQHYKKMQKIEEEEKKKEAETKKKQEEEYEKNRNDPFLKYYLVLSELIPDRQTAVHLSKIFVEIDEIKTKLQKVQEELGLE